MQDKEKAKAIISESRVVADAYAKVLDKVLRKQRSEVYGALLDSYRQSKPEAEVLRHLSHLVALEDTDTELKRVIVVGNKYEKQLQGDELNGEAERREADYQRYHGP